VLDVVLKFDPDYVIHLASNKFRGKIDSGFERMYQENVLMSLNLIQACQNLCKIKRFIFLGSCDEYGYSKHPFDETQCEFPTSVYGLSKLAITKILIALYQTNRFPAVILRPSIIYGPYQGADMFLSALIQSLREKRDFLMSPGNQYRDFVFIDDVTNAIELAILADEKICGQIINIADGESIQLYNLVKLVSNQFDDKAIQLIKIGAISYRDRENMFYSVNINKAREILGWMPEVCLKDGLKRTIQCR
jgi:nucleoside-diphosphate-sugar epimerase